MELVSKLQSFDHINRNTRYLEGLEVRESLLQGLGVFTTVPIAAGTTVIVWGGTVMTQADFERGAGLRHSNVGLAEGIVLAQSVEDGLGMDDYMNHSCDPNLWLDDEVTLVARRNIKVGEELTIDYAVEVGDQTYVMKIACSCGSLSCRGKITGLDWQFPSIQSRYAGHFSPFIGQRISNLRTLGAIYEK